MSLKAFFRQRHPPPNPLAYIFTSFCPIGVKAMSSLQDQGRRLTHRRQTMDLMERLSRDYLSMIKGGMLETLIQKRSTGGHAASLRGFGQGYVCRTLSRTASIAVTAAARLISSSALSRSSTASLSRSS